MGAGAVVAVKKPFVSGVFYATKFSHADRLRCPLTVVTGLTSSETHSCSQANNKYDPTSLCLLSSPLPLPYTHSSCL